MSIGERLGFGRFFSSPDRGRGSGPTRPPVDEEMDPDEMVGVKQEKTVGVEKFIERGILPGVVIKITERPGALSPIRIVNGLWKVADLNPEDESQNTYARVNLYPVNEDGSPRSVPDETPWVLGAYLLDTYAYDIEVLKRGDLALKKDSGKTDPPLDPHRELMNAGYAVGDTVMTELGPVLINWCTFDPARGKTFVTLMDPADKNSAKKTSDVAVLILTLEQFVARKYKKIKK